METARSVLRAADAAYDAAMDAAEADINAARVTYADAFEAANIAYNAAMEVAMENNNNDKTQVRKITQ